MGQRTKSQIIEDLWDLYESAFIDVKTEGATLASPQGAKVHPSWSVCKDAINCLNKLHAFEEVEEKVRELVLN